MTNITIIVGRLACDPETNKTPAGKGVTHICVVTDRPARDKDGKSYKDERGFTLATANSTASLVLAVWARLSLVFAPRARWFRSRGGSITPCGRTMTGSPAMVARSWLTRSSF
jgi:hypothetical protein